jgi:hypothetical protein
MAGFGCPPRVQRRITRKRTFFTAFFFRISSRAGITKAAIAVAHRMLEIVYCMMRDRSSCREQGATTMLRNSRLCPKTIDAMLPGLKTAS